MSDLKNQIFTLLKKSPDYVFIVENLIEATYYNTDFITYKIQLIPGEKDILSLYIYSSSNTFNKRVELTEKEFMDIKWKIEDWKKELEIKALEDFAKFSESEPNSMDDLLND